MHLHHRVIVLNKSGLHARPAAYVASIVRSYDAKVTFSMGEKKIDASQVMELLLLEAKKNATIDVEVVGQKADELLRKLIWAFKNEFRVNR